jgi:hypothetical protein
MVQNCISITEMERYPQRQREMGQNQKMVQNCEQEDEERYIHLGHKRMCIDLNKKLIQGKSGIQADHHEINQQIAHKFVFYQSSPNLVMEVDENDEQSITAPCCFRHSSAAWSSAGLTAGQE